MTLSSIQKALPGFEHIRRSWSDAHESFLAHIQAGEYYVTRNDEGVITVLGSCIAACIRDKVSGIGGMNHFLLPDPAGDEIVAGKLNGVGAAARYGNYAMDYLIDAIVRNGGQRQNLEVKLFGGGRIIENMSDVGARNINFVRAYLKARDLAVVSEDVGDVFPRKVIYFPETGRVKVKRLRSLHNNIVADQEKRYLEDMTASRQSGSAKSR